MKIDGYEVGIDREDTLLMPPGAGPSAGAVHLFLGPAGFSWGGLLSGVKGADGLPSWGSVARDQILRSSRYVSGLWGSVVAKCITKIATRGYTLEDDTDSQQRLKRAKDILESYGPGYTKGITRGMQDYLGTNFGQVIAIERAKNAPGARITGLIHLDALRCTPTWDPEYPILYYSPHGGVFLLPAWGVIRITDMPSSDPLAYDYGQCASDRAWEAIIQDAAITTYFREKITGSRNLAIYIIRGLTYQQLNDALTTSKAEREARNFIIYKGSTLIPLLSDTEVQLTEIPLASVPDGFDVDQARQDIRLRFANAAGVAVQDIAPLSGQGLGTGTQSVIQDEAYEGMGLAVYPKLLAEALNEKVFPPSTNFKVFTNDLRDRKVEAEVRGLQTDVILKLVGNPTAPGIISQQQGLNLASDWGVVPKEFLPQQADATPGGTLTSDEKPVTLPEQAQTVLDQVQQLTASGQQPTMKELAQVYKALEKQAQVEGLPVVWAATKDDADRVLDAQSAVTSQMLLDLVLRQQKEATDVDAVVERALNDRRAWEWARLAIGGPDETT